MKMVTCFDEKIDNSAYMPVVEFVWQYLAQSSFWKWLESNKKIIRFSRGDIRPHFQNEKPQVGGVAIFIEAESSDKFFIRFRAFFSPPKIELLEDLSTWKVSEYDGDKSILGRKTLKALEEGRFEMPLTEEYNELRRYLGYKWDFKRGKFLGHGPPREKEFFLFSLGPLEEERYESEAKYWITMLE